MIASPTSARERTPRRTAAAATRAVCALLLGALLGGCASRPPTSTPDLLVPIGRPVSWLPRDADLAASRAAAAALANDRAALDEAVAEIAAISPAEKDEQLDALAQDVVHAMLDDPRAYREASRVLVRHAPHDPSLEARLRQEVADDPLMLARRRRRDTWEGLFARTFNAASRPLGQAIFSGFVLAPMTVASSSAHYLASFSNDEPLSTTDRQALALRRDYLLRNPEADDAGKVREQVSGAEKKLARTQQRRHLRSARSAESSGNLRVAIVETQRVLYWGENEEAEEIRARARAELASTAALHARSFEPAPALRMPRADDRALMVELLNTSARAESLSPATLRALAARRDEPDGEALYLLALAQAESGYEEESEATLAELAARDPARAPMARHARAIQDDPWQSPYTSWRALRERKRNEEIRFRLFADYAYGTRYPNLPRLLAYTLESPGVASALVTSPMRMVLGRWKKGPDFHRATAALGYRYLDRHPDGTHSREVMGWLFDYEADRGNAAAALRLADFLPDVGSDRRDELVEQTAEGTLAAADRMPRADRRRQVLHQATTEFPDSDSGHVAGQRIRAELQHGTPQSIRVTRGFLQENPRVSGANGLGLNPELIDGDVENGELHPSGVAFVGGRGLRFYLLAESGDEEDAPEEIDRAVSKERLARVAAVLDETTRRNQLIDADDTLPPDADRDRFLEQARLGLVDQADARPAAQSTFVYESMRERYGIVRGRESILPFELVFQGSFDDLQLGAYPRWRTPKQTPDAFLYR